MPTARSPTTSTRRRSRRRSSTRRRRRRRPATRRAARRLVARTVWRERRWWDVVRRRRASGSLARPVCLESECTGEFFTNLADASTAVRLWRARARPTLPALTLPLHPRVVCRPPCYRTLLTAFLRAPPPRELRAQRRPVGTARGILKGCCGGGGTIMSRHKNRRGEEEAKPKRSEERRERRTPTHAHARCMCVCRRPLSSSHRRSRPAAIHTTSPQKAEREPLPDRIIISRPPLAGPMPDAARLSRCLCAPSPPARRPPVLSPAESRSGERERERRSVKTRGRRCREWGCCVRACVASRTCW